MFGTANQLLATIALAVGTSYIINRGRIRYAWITIIPMLFVGFTTITAAILNIKNIYLPQAADPASAIPGIINLVLTLVILVCVIIIFSNAIPAWVKAFRERGTVIPAELK
jgi:carbon starvation protein